MSLKEQNQLLNDYASHLGIRRCAPHEGDKGPLWDGEALEELEDPSDTAHELAHWILATPEQRQQLNYGWQWDWKYPGYHPEGVWQRPEGGFEEHLCCMLQFAMLARIGYRSLWEVYKAYGYIEDGRLDEDVVPARKTAQPYVEQFALWLASK